MPIEPMELMLDEAHEITGTGTIFADKDNRPVLHMHIACGREGMARDGGRPV